MSDTPTDWKDFIKNRTGIDYSDSNTLAGLAKEFKKQSFFFFFVLISAIAIYYASTDKNALSNKTYIYSAAIILPLLFGVFMSSQLFEGSSSGMNPAFIFLGLGVFVLLIMGVSYLFSVASPSTFIVLNYFLATFLFLAIIGGLAIFYLIFSNYLKKQTGPTGFFIKLIFYIPCLYYDFLAYIKEQYKLTPGVVFIVAALELVYVVAYYYLPKLYDYIIKSTNHSIMTGPVKLNKQVVIANSDLFELQTSSAYPTKTEKNYRNSNYSVSFWSYVNSGGGSTDAYMDETTIFDYAGGKPRVTYTNSPEVLDTYTIYFSNNQDGSGVVSYTVKLPAQKWNYFAFNYFDGKADLFINGKLERTFVFDNNNVPHNGRESDRIIVGSPGGLDGAICSVNYNKNVMSISQISREYNLLRYRNPPIIA